MYDEAIGPASGRKKKKSMRYDSQGNYIKPEDRKGEWDSYEITEALRCLTTAAKIRRNPALMTAVKAEAKKQMEAAKATASSL